jgi:L-alanine-DL-glutamate epimerase-like enolase superfamily enzyme
MRVVELTAYHLRIPLRKTIRHASHTRTDNDTLVVRCRLDDGTVGWGEGLPREYVTGETIDSTFETLKATDLSTQLGSPFASLEEAVTIVDRFAVASVGSNGRDCFGNAARCAVELAFLDAAGRACGKPLSAVTNLIGESVGIRKSQDRVRYSGAITSMGRIREWIRAWKLRLNQFHQTKVKVGVEGVNDAASLATIRRVLGKDVDIRIDANEAWTCENLEQHLAPLMPFNITSLEQPVPHEDVDGLAAVRARISTPIMLDESLCSLSDAQRAIERGTCDLFNIRLSKCGGFLPSLHIAALAHRAGLGYQLGCQVGETGILSAAGRHFASSVDGIRYLEGSFDRYLVKEPLTIEDLTFGYRGFAPALDGPGLSVTIDEAAIARTTARQDVWAFG